MAAALMTTLWLSLSVAGFPGQGPGPGAQATEASHTVSVRAVRVAPSGSADVLVGAPVVLERWVQPMRQHAARTLEAAWQTTTNGLGQAELSGIPPAKPGRQDVVRVQWRGVSWPSPPIERYERPIELAVYEPTTRTDDLAFDMHIVLNPSEGRFIVQQRATIQNDSLSVVDADAAGGIRIPLLLPRVFDGPINWGLIPKSPHPERVRFDRAPEIGRLQVERGAFVYRGPVPPGAVLSVTLSYPISYDDGQDYVLAMSPPLDVARLLLQVVHTDRFAPLVSPRQATRPALRDSGETRERYLTVLDPPKAGMEFVVDIERTPSRGPLYSAIALGGAVLLALAALLALLTGRVGAAGLPRRDG